VTASLWLRVRHPVRWLRWRRIGDALTMLVEGDPWFRILRAVHRLTCRVFEMTPHQVPFLSMLREEDP